MDRQRTAKTNIFSERAWTGLASVEVARGSIYKTHPNVHVCVRYSSSSELGFKGLLVLLS